MFNNAPMDARAVQTAFASGVSINPATCASAVAPVLEGTYAGSGYTGLATQGLQEPKPGRHKVIQAVVAFPDAAAAQHFYAQQLSVWQGCKLTDVTVSYTNGNPTITPRSPWSPTVRASPPPCYCRLGRTTPRTANASAP